MRTLILFLICFTALQARAQVSTPFLRLDVGNHLPTTRKICSDATGSLLLTAGDDKTARLWDGETGRNLKTLRIPIGPGSEGMLFSCALSPDGKTAALGGYTGWDWDTSYTVYLFNTSTGEIFNRITNFPSTINELEYTPSGKHLVASSEGTVYVFNSGDYDYVKELKSNNHLCYGVAFDRSGRMVSVNQGSRLALYDAEFNLVKEVTNLSGKYPYTVSITPDGSKIAVSFADDPRMEVRDGRTLALLYYANTQDIDGLLLHTVFSNDGQVLFAANSASIWNGEVWKMIIRRWEQAGKGAYRDFEITDNSIFELRSLPNKRLLMVSANSEILMLDENCKTIWSVDENIKDYRNADASHFRVNDGGNVIHASSRYSDVLRFDLLTRKLDFGLTEHNSSVSSRTNIKITDYKDEYEPKLNNKKLTFLQDRETCRSVDVADDDRSFVLGAEWTIYCGDSKGNLLWKTDIPSVAWAVNICDNNKVVSAILADGTIRFYRMKDGAEILAFFLHRDNKRWVVFTPSGYYDASPGAEEFLGWHINRSKRQAAVFFPASRFRDQYYRPDVIDEIIWTLDESLALKKANANAQKSNVVQDRIQDKLPPNVIIRSPASGAKFSSQTIEIEYLVESPQDAPAKNLRILVNGRPVAQERGLKPAAGNQKVRVNLPKEDCVVTLLADNDNGTSPETSISLKWTAASEEVIYKPKLYVLAIGVSKYKDPSLTLEFAAKDANDFCNSLLKQKGLLYSDVVIQKLVDQTASKEAITDGLDWIQRQTGQKDLAMIFFAGHGINDNNGIFYMLPVGADMERVRSTCLNFEELRQTVSSIAGKVVVFIDACHSGNVMGAGRRGHTDVNAVVNELSSTENGAVTFTSSTGKEYSLEDKAWGNGAFTKALIEGLGGKAAFPGITKITVKSLDYYISERVKELTKGRQHPTSVTPPNVPDFPIAISQ